MQYHLFYFIAASRVFFYCSRPYNCNIFMQDLQVGRISGLLVQVGAYTIC